jgi:hypothetical protein
MVAARSSPPSRCPLDSLDERSYKAHTVLDRLNLAVPALLGAVAGAAARRLLAGSDGAA